MEVACDNLLATGSRPDVLQVYLLGTVDFEAALALQKKLHYDISGDRSQAALILCEHPPLITVGRQGSRTHILYEPAELRVRRWPIRWVNRGGGCVLHLPGQLAMYPILPLDRLHLSVADYLQHIAAIVQEMLKDFHLRAQVSTTSSGVFLGQRMFASIGVAVRDWVSYYGAYINVQPPLDLCRKVLPGPNQEPMTSLERERRGPVRPALVRERLIELWAERLGFARTALFSDHPFLQAFPRRRPRALAHEPSC
jgi:lipoyl(octanoyl) transferase